MENLIIDNFTTIIGKDRQSNGIELRPVSDSILVRNNLEQIGSTIKYDKPFIVANTSESSLQNLKNDCIIPVFSKDNEKTIAHQEFIELAQDCVSKVFPHQSISTPEIRVSHQIKGRTPDAIYKNAKELLDHEKTQYFERMAFVIKIPSITDTINGNTVALT